jgi:hypothetical protein
MFCVKDAVGSKEEQDIAIARRHFDAALGLLILAQALENTVASDECGSTGSRKAANEMGALPAFVLHVVSAGRVCQGGRGGCPCVQQSAVRIVGAEVRCRMAIVRVRTAIVPALDHGFGIS